MPQQRIIELEAQLRAAQETVAQLTLANAGLTAELASAETMLKRSRRNSRNDASNFQSQITTLQNRRG